MLFNLRIIIIYSIFNKTAPYIDAVLNNMLMSSFFLKGMQLKVLCSKHNVEV